ncbi:MAG TPA: HIRAN domain-containing protein [Jatrophihabitans sp.]
MELKGTEHRQDAILSLLPRRGLRDGVDLETTGQLIPEPTNPYDANAIGCWVQGRLIGYLPREEAARYTAPLAQFVRSGLVPTTNVRLWVREFEEYDYDGGREAKKKRYYTSARVGLAEPDLLGPVNLAPPKPRAELPDGGAVKVTGTQENLQHLLAVLADRSAAWAYGVLEPMTLSGARSSKTVVQVSINGRPAGTLSPQMSTYYLPIVQPLTAAGCHAVVRVLLKGSPVSVAATVYAARAHEIPREWFHNLQSDLGISLSGL